MPQDQCLPHLDDDGKSLWEQCDWIINGGATETGTPLKLQALAIRRQLRLESEYAFLLASHADLLDILETIVAEVRCGTPTGLRNAAAKAREVIAKAKAKTP